MLEVSLVVHDRPQLPKPGDRVMAGQVIARVGGKVQHQFDCPLPMRGGTCTCSPDVEAAQLDVTGIHDPVWADGYDQDGGPDA